MSTRSFQPGDTYGKVFTIKNATGALANADSLPAGTLYRNEAADGAVTVTVANLATGIYKATCTIPGTYSVGDRISPLITAAVGGVATGEIVEDFRLVGWPNTALPNAAAGAAGGLPTADAANGVKLSVGTGTGQVNVGSGKVPATLAAGDVTGNLPAQANALAAGAITASAFAAGAITSAAMGASCLDSVVIETGVNLPQAISAIAAVCAGASSGVDVGSPVYKAINNPGTTRISATATAGNRSSVTLNLPAI